MRSLMILIILSSMIFTNCNTKNYGKLDPGVVKTLDVEKYLGIWYEIYRLPMRAENDLVNVTATYSIRDDGDIKVLNQGYKFTPEGKHKKATAKAWIPDKDIQGALIVKFFGLFKSSYHVLYIDENYQHAIVSTYNRKYAWILAREPYVLPNLEMELVSKAAEMGVDTSQFIKTLQKWN